LVFLQDSRVPAAVERKKTTQKKMWAKATLALVMTSSAVGAACSVAPVIELRTAVENGACGQADLPLMFGVDHATATALPRGPLPPPSFASLNGPAMVQFNVPLPRTQSRMYAGITPWNARGGMDTIATMTQMMLGSKEVVIESSATTLLSLFLQDKSTARARFMCAVVKEQEELKQDRFVWKSLLRFLNHFVDSVDQPEAQIQRLCPLRPELVRDALAVSRRCPAAASMLARFVVDAMMTQDPTVLFNPDVLDASTKFKLAGVNPATILYFSAYPQTASQFGNLVVIFAPSARSLDLRHFARQGRFHAYFNRTQARPTLKLPSGKAFKSLSDMIEPVVDAGELLVPSHIFETALGFDLKRSSGALVFGAGLSAGVRSNNGSDANDLVGFDFALSLAEASPIVTSTAFHAVKAFGFAFIAVATPSDNRTYCVEFVAEPTTGFYACDLQLGPRQPLFPVPVARVDSGSVPVHALVFRAVDRVDEACQAAGALLAQLNAHAKPAPLDERGSAMLRRVLQSWNHMYSLVHGQDRCELAVAAPGLKKLEGNWVPAQSFLGAKDTPAVDFEALARPGSPANDSHRLRDYHCQATIPESCVLDDDSRLRRERGADHELNADGNAFTGDTVVIPIWKPVKRACKLVCSVLGILVPVDSADKVCTAMARRLVIGFEPSDKADPFPVAQALFPEERLAERVSCAPEPSSFSTPSSAQRQAWVRAPSAPFVVLATRLVSAAAYDDDDDDATAARVRSEVERLRLKHVNVIEIDVSASPQPPRRMFHFNGRSVSLAWGSAVVEATADYTVVVCAAACPPASRRVLIVDPRTVRRGRVLVVAAPGESGPGAAGELAAAGALLLLLLVVWAMRRYGLLPRPGRVKEKV